MMMRGTLFTTVALALSMTACSDPAGPAGNPDGPGTSADQAGPSSLRFAVETVDDATTGFGTAVVVDQSDRVHVLYFDEFDAPCLPQGGAPLPQGGQASPLSYRAARLYHAPRGADGSYQRGLVSGASEPVSTNGLSALADPKSGQPLVAYMGGTKGAFYCGGSDMVLGRYDGSAWSRATVATQSTAGAGAPEQSPDVVGAWNALAADRSGNLLLAWQDMHYGGFQADDLKKADVELAIGQGAAAPTPTGEIIAAAGAGLYNSLAADAQGQVLLAYSGWVSGGVTVARRQSAGKWTFTSVAQGAAVPSAIAVAPRSGKIAVAYYDANLKLLRLAESSDGKTFTSDVVDRDGDTGRYLALRYDAQDRPVVAYYKCGDYQPNRGCDSTRDALRVARRRDDLDGAWQIADVDDGGDGACGAYLGLALTSAGKAVVSYQCNLFRAASGQFLPAVRVALEQ